MAILQFPNKEHHMVKAELKEILLKNGIESLILAHAQAGLDVSSPAYVTGLRSSLEAIANHY